MVFGCDQHNNNDDDDGGKTGKVSFSFIHLNRGSPQIFDSLMYENSAGNKYLVNEIQYFITDVALHREDETITRINAWKEIHYVDTDIPQTHTWEVFDEIPTGNYDSISFTFGFVEEDNQSFMFVNPPESYMFWPEVLGGGYHYLKLNGKWLSDSTGLLKPFLFHLGIGQIYENDIVHVENIIEFVHNYFKVSLPVSFVINENQKTGIKIKMEVDSWFNSPHIFDFDIWGGDIMQNQAAMSIAKDNGKDAFTAEAFSSIE